MPQAANSNRISHPIRTYAAFWPFYLQEHHKPQTRAMHYAGTALVFVALALGIFVSPWFFIGMAVGGYGFAWVSHFFIEHNRPATFTYPLWSLVSDFRMAALWASGRLRPHLARAGVLNAS
jgi:hypothetical protein